MTFIRDGFCLLVTLGLSLMACMHASKTIHPDQAQKVDMSKVDCPPAPEGIDTIIKPGSITLFGEIHGTVEVPSFLSAVACHVPESVPLLVGLEMPYFIKHKIQRYLDSDGSLEEKTTLLENSFWFSRDGRSSQAMLDLLDQLRKLKRAGRRVDVFGFDGIYSIAEDRDKGMAQRIVSKLRSYGVSQAVTLLLSGNLHARTASDQWMGWYVRKSFPTLVALNNQYAAGKAWVCMNKGCGPTSIRGEDRGPAGFVKIKETPDEHGYHGFFYVGPISASPPAQSEKEPDVATKKRMADAARDQASHAYKAKSFSECVDLYLESAMLSTRSMSKTSDFYNAACCAALAVNTEDAFTFLNNAIKYGYRDAKHLQQDADLASLHKSPSWKEVVADVARKQHVFEKNNNPELAQILEQDQRDRQVDNVDQIDWSVVSQRDTQRRTRVTEILDEGGATSSTDYFRAAMIFQHGDKPEDYLRSHELALRAVELDPNNDSARWLAAASKDRHLMTLGKPQLYGTQFRKVDGKWDLYDVDPSVTDEERAKWNVPPLAEAHQRVKKLNESSR